MGDTASTGGATQLCKPKGVSAGTPAANRITAFRGIRQGGVQLQRLPKEGRKRKATDPLGTGGTHAHTHTGGGTHRATENRKGKRQKRKERKRKGKKKRRKKRKRKGKRRNQKERLHLFLSAPRASCCSVGLNRGWPVRPAALETFLA